ncbi:hypothetical protein LSAT2_024340 [Lamellibrachia satsuma]|nr:hypothetical protein LSAT2_024340 [Lamellibrachia satsuma]
MKQHIEYNLLLPTFCNRHCLAASYLSNSTPADSHATLYRYTKCPDVYGYMCMAGNTGKRSSWDAGDNMKTRRKSLSGRQPHGLPAFLPNWLHRPTMSTRKARLRQRQSGHASVADVRLGSDSAILKLDLWRLMREAATSNLPLEPVRSDTYQESKVP